MLPSHKKIMFIEAILAHVDATIWLSRCVGYQADPNANIRIICIERQFCLFLIVWVGIANHKLHPGDYLQQKK